MTTALAEPITLCIINYNGLAYLREALTKVWSLSVGFDEILVVDNASTDGSLTYLETVEGVTVLAMATNTGPAGARNAGFRQARNDVILFQDNDIGLQDGAVEALYASLQKDTNVVLGMPRVMYRDHPGIIQFEGADCHLLGMMSLRQANVATDCAPLETTRTSSMVSACFMIDRRRWHSRTRRDMHGRDQPLFDEGFIFNLEDHDFGVRANLLGCLIVAVPQATVLHGDGTKGLSYRPWKEASPTRMYCLIRNRWWIVLRYYSLRSLLLLAPLLILFELLQLMGVVGKGWGKQWWRAATDTCRHFPMLRAERRIYQARRRRNDREILSSGKLPLTQAIKSGHTVRGVIGAFEALTHGYWMLARKIL